MLMADTLAIFFVVLGLLLAFPGLWLLCRGLWPEAVAGATETCRRGIWKSFLAGLPATLMMIVLVAVLSKLGALGGTAAIAVICLYMIHAHAGVAGLAACVGERLAPETDAAPAWRTLLRGALALELSYLLPILGWFVILPASIIIGSGAATISLVKRWRASSPIKATSFLPDQTAAAASDVSGFHVGGQVGASQ